jgi:secondary thiamine-phosphate synthase enzyme
MQKIITLRTDRRNGLYDITSAVVETIRESKVNNGIVSVYARGSTAAIMIQENWDQSVQNDVVNLLSRMIPSGIWEHDHQDNNGDSHLKSGLVGPSETIPVIDGNPGLSTWQNIFFCEFDGPRQKREIVVTVLGE